MDDQRLVQFVQVYHQAIEENFEAFGRQNFPLHGAKTPIVQIYLASDGIAIFYLDPPPDLPDPANRPGYYVLDKREISLDTLCQSTTLRYVKVGSGNIGQTYHAISPLPPDVEVPPGLSGLWFTSEFRAAAKDGLLKTLGLPGVMIAPLVRVENGIRTKLLPSRFKLWSPTIDIPGRGLVRLYDWPHADFLWLPDQLALDPAHAVELAQLDVFALLNILQTGPITPQVAEQDPLTHAAELIEKQCQEFETLLNTYGNNEERIHQWLKERPHWIFLDSKAVELRSKLGFGDYVSDFVVRKADGTYLLIEIEPAATPIFNKGNNELTQKFNHACQQVKDWRRYIRDNAHTVRIEQGLTDIYEPDGMVVLGRSLGIAPGEATTRWRDLKNSSDLHVFTYDELILGVKAIATSMRSMGQG